jgi:5-methylcytosine-specific restriction endonuclease McrA
MTTLPSPSAEAQLVFLAKLQRLFAEGDFTATYKYALLISLSDLAVELGTDDGEDLPLTTRQLAERFVHLYWRHALPYGTGRPGSVPGVLVQNMGAQAAVLSAISEFRSGSGAATLPQAAAHAVPYAALLTRVAATVSAQPLNYLQNFGGVTDQFLYERLGAGAVRLKPGVAYCLRRFHTLVQQLARFQWVEHIKANRRNHSILGDAGDLGDFLFSTSRQSLALIGEGLSKLDGPRCFYCGHAMTAFDVDHYVPFSLYSRDLAHNFVLAHLTCNRSKSDTLAAKPHLERWLERFVKRSDDLAEIGLSAGVASDPNTSKRVAAWGYASSVASGGRAWVSPSQYQPVDGEYLALFSGSDAAS